MPTLSNLSNRAPLERGSGVPIHDLRADAKALTRGAFEERYGRAFLVLSAAELAAARPAITEVRLEGNPRRAHAESTAGISLLVFAVRRNGRSASHLITLGRAPDNDVVVPDVSVSRFHAFVKEGGSGGWLMQDTGSTNGTTVNGHAVLRQGHGPPTELSSGDDVRLGQVELTFLDGDALLSFALQLER